MNIENVNKAIAVMERVKERGDAFDLCTWQSYAEERDALTTEKDLHQCGTAACFAGWVAVSPEFQADGGGVCKDGSPWIFVDTRLLMGAAIAYWLDIPKLEAEDLCGLNNSKRVYGVEMEEEVTVDQVLAALYRLRDTGTVYIKETAQ